MIPLTNVTPINSVLKNIRNWNVMWNIEKILKIKFHFNFWHLLVFAALCLRNSKTESKNLIFKLLHSILEKNPNLWIYVCILSFLMISSIYSCIFLHYFSSIYPVLWPLPRCHRFSWWPMTVQGWWSGPSPWHGVGCSWSDMSGFQWHSKRLFKYFAQKMT